MEKATALLGEIEQQGIFNLKAGYAADIKRPKDGGKGLDGVVMNTSYFNPFIELMKGGK
ncbi:MAG: lysine 5,6-aminomutase subunit alpha [Eubacterium sp.]